MSVPTRHTSPCALGELPFIYVVRHGETAWSHTGQHTGRTDLELTEKGVAAAHALRLRLGAMPIEHVFVSPLRRARQTCELAGFGDRARTDPDLLEWDYGEYEGRRTEEILRDRPGWELFRDGSPGGETPEDVTRRADRIVERMLSLDRAVILFSSGHILRALAARWLDFPISIAAKLQLSTASVSCLGYGHDRAERALHTWNDTGHLGILGS